MKSIYRLKSFALAMMTVAAIISLRNLPLSAEYGLAACFYFLVAIIGFFIPIAMATAELTTMLPCSGGCYTWVSQAFCKPLGFFTLWIAWMESIAWFPAILGFTATLLAYLLSFWFPGLENDIIFKFSVIIIIFWVSTYLNFLGLDFSSKLTYVGTILGTVIPGIFIIMLAIIWVWSGNPTQIQWSLDKLIPDFELNNVSLFAGILLGFAGVELATFHIRDTANPQKDYPKALFMASIIIFVLSILGTLSIAIVVPKDDLNLLAGVIQAFQTFFERLNLPWMVPVIALLMLIGALASINTWIIGPAKGMLAAVTDHFLPPQFAKINHKQIPTTLLLLQAIVGSILSLVFLYMDDSSSAFWILTGLSAQFTMIQYFMVFCAVVYLRYKKPQLHRPFKIPGGQLVMLSCCGVGALLCILVFALVFIPPAQLQTGSSNVFQIMLAISLLVLSMPPVYFIWYRHKLY